MPLKQGNKKTDISQTSLQMEMANKIEGEVTGWGFWKRCFFFFFWKRFLKEILCVEKREPCTLLVERYTGTAFMENGRRPLKSYK